METREMTCIRCPLGCVMQVAAKSAASETDDGTGAAAGGSVTADILPDEIVVSGNTCPRGAEYARKEMQNPSRTVTSAVRIAGGELAMVPVRTRTDIPKGKIPDVMREIHSARVQAPVCLGDVVLSDCAGTGVDVVATRSVGRKSGEKTEN